MMGLTILSCFIASIESNRGSDRDLCSYQVAQILGPDRRNSVLKWFALPYDLAVFVSPWQGFKGSRFLSV
ncbi:MAG: hypothetical protein JWP89_5397 [Schlesneria sp.]|nr:hypothetical protein [Schlesneria sp.]